MQVYRYKGGVAKYIYKLSRGITVDKYWYNGIGQTSPDHTRPVYGETQSRYRNPPRATKTKLRTARPASRQSARNHLRDQCTAIHSLVSSNKNKTPNSETSVSTIHAQPFARPVSRMLDHRLANVIAQNPAIDNAIETLISNRYVAKSFTDTRGSP